MCRFSSADPPEPSVVLSLPRVGANLERLDSLPNAGSSALTHEHPHFLCPSCACDKGEKATLSHTLPNERHRGGGNRVIYFYRGKRRAGGKSFFSSRARHLAGRVTDHCVLTLGPFTFTGAGGKRQGHLSVVCFHNIPPSFTLPAVFLCV